MCVDARETRREGRAQSWLTNVKGGWEGGRSADKHFGNSSVSEPIVNVFRYIEQICVYKKIVFVKN